MKIGMILDAPFPTDPRVSNEASALINAGHEVFLFCISFKNDFKRNDILNSIKVKRYYCSNILYKFSALAYTFPFYKYFMSRKISHFIKENEIEHLHIHDIQIASSVFHANKTNIPTTLDLHENRPEIMKFYKHVNSNLGKILISPKKWKIAEEKYIKLSDNIIVVTKAAKDEISKRISIESKKITVYPNTVKKQFYKNYDLNNSIINRFKSKFVLLYLGNTSKRRGLDMVINSIVKLKNLIPNLMLVVVGSSSYDNSLKSLVIKNKVKDFVSFEGWKNETEFPSYLSIANIGISPLTSNIHHDTTYANKIFQYMSFGCPLICSDVLAQKEIIEKYKVGELFKTENSDDFSKSVLELYKNSEKLKTYSVNCKIAIENHLNNEIVSQQIVSMYAK